MLRRDGLKWCRKSLSKISAQEGEEGWRSTVFPIRLCVESGSTFKLMLPQKLDIPVWCG